MLYLYIYLYINGFRYLKYTGINRVRLKWFPSQEYGKCQKWLF